MAININPKHKGDFTALAKNHKMSVQGFASFVLRNKGRFSAHVREMANFARNAKSFKH